MIKKILFLTTLFVMIGCSTDGQLQGTWRYVEYDFTTTKTHDGVLLETLKGVVTYPASQQKTVTFNPNGTCTGLYSAYWLLVDNTIKIKDSVASTTYNTYTIKYLSDTKLILESITTVADDSLVYNTATTHYFER